MKKPYAILSTQEVNTTISWQIQYEGEVYEVYSYWAGSCRNSVYSGSLVIYREWWLRAPWRWHLNSVEKRIAKILELRHKDRHPQDRTALLQIGGKP